MTEKRFTYEYDEYNGNLFDNEFNTFYHIEDSDENIELLCNRLNELVEENEQLRKQNEELINGMQETARLSAKAITKPMVEERWGKGVDYD